MNRNDKVIVLFGVLILVLASVGIYYWAPEELKPAVVGIKDLYQISGVFSDEPDAMTISDTSPFYALIATPLAIHYDLDGTQHVKPFYVKNLEQTSSAIERVETQLGMQVDDILDESKSAKENSLYVAQIYWEKSEAVLIIEDNESGYNLGVVATPLASYLSIPVIVTNEIDQDVRAVLDDLGVKYSLVCGDLEGYGDYIKFDNVDEIVDASVRLVQEKFGDVKYITLTNPRDAWSPEVLNTTVVLEESCTVRGGNALPSHVLDFFRYGTGKSFSFEIPESYKYALVKLDVKNLEDPKYIEEFGDDVVIGGSLIAYTRTSAYPGERDEDGKLKCDTLHFETVKYDSEGKEFTVTLSPATTTFKSLDLEITVTVEKLSDPYYSVMKQFSSVAPYLTAYHEGIIFAKPEFAFVADDDKVLNGKKLAGDTQVFNNPLLIPLINQHVYENIHIPLNELLAKITSINTTHIENIKYLKEECDQNPFYIALVGDTIMLPQYYYRSPHSDPFDKLDRYYGVNCPSDYIYGNIDPEMYSLVQYPEDYLENDIYSYFPEVENIVGRIVGFDVQDASALIARTIFYDKIIDEMDEWKNNAVALTGAGAEVQKLPIVTAINKILSGKTEPTKFPSGEKYFIVKRILKNFEEGGFNAQSAQRGRAQRAGLSTKALLDIKTDGILNLLTFPFMLVKMRQGFENVDSLSSLRWWIETALSDGSGVNGGELEQNSNLIIGDSHAIWFGKYYGDVLVESLGGPRILYQLLGRYLHIPGLPSIRTPLGDIGAYNVRAVSEMKMGPSVMLIEGCGSGKIDGFLPTNSLANAYLHAGVNAYISPTTYSAFYGALEPRPNFNGGVGLGIMGYINAFINTKKGNYVPLYFNQLTFENMVLEMAEDNVDIGAALRDAKNVYLPAQFNISFRWTPVLFLPSNLPDEVRIGIESNMKTTSSDGGTFPVEKYCTIYQMNLLGDPAFNPYEPCNEGNK